MTLISERWDSAKWMPPWTRHQHCTRYEFVSSFARNRRVIDAACGVGLCARPLLSGGAQHVDGFDKCFEAVSEARERFGGERVSFGVADVMALPVADEAYDLFVCLETIEHVADARALLKEVVRALKPGGVLVCSTPNRALSNPGASLDDKPFNPYHAREYVMPELKRLLEQFVSISWLGQSFYSERYAAALAAAARYGPRLGIWLHRLVKLASGWLDRPSRHRPSPLKGGYQPEILIAVCTKHLSSGR